MSFVHVLEAPRRPLRQAGAVLLAGSLILWSGVASAAGNPPQSFAGLAKKVTPAVVYIVSTLKPNVTEQHGQGLPFNFPPGSPFEKFFKQFQQNMGNGNGQQQQQPQAIERAVGSGFIIDPSGYIVTNNHVVKDSTEVQVRLSTGNEYKAKIIGTDPMTDLALLKIKADHPLPSVHFGNSDKTEVGDWVMAVGNPFGLASTVTAGIVSARGRDINSGPYDDFLQIDAPINKGNSGGPLFNMDGQVVGINTAIYSPNGGSVGIGFAVPSDLAKPVIAQLRKHGTVDRGWLGVHIQQVTPDLAKAVGLDKATGAIVSQVTKDSPAQKAGLKQGDVILNFDGHTVKGARDLARQVGADPAGTKADVGILRNGSKMTLSVVTGERPKSLEMASNEQTPPAAKTTNGVYHSDVLNSELASLTKHRREQFGIPADVHGVVILRVASTKMLEQGLRPGDVIKEVGQSPVKTPRQVERLLDKAKAKDRKSVLLLVDRQGQDLFLGIKLNVA